MRKIFLIFIFVFLSACAKKNYVSHDNPQVTAYEKMQSSNLQYHIIWEKFPIDSKKVNFFIQFTQADADGHILLAPLQDELHVFLWMPDMGHGSAPVKVEFLSPGLYRVSEASFFMAGLWEVHIQIKQDETILDQGVYEVSL